MRKPAIGNQMSETIKLRQLIETTFRLVVDGTPLHIGATHTILDVDTKYFITFIYNGEHWLIWANESM